MRTMQSQYTKPLLVLAVHQTVLWSAVLLGVERDLVLLIATSIIWGPLLVIAILTIAVWIQTGKCP